MIYLDTYSTIHPRIKYIGLESRHFISRGTASGSDILWVYLPAFGASGTRVEDCYIAGASKASCGSAQGVWPSLTLCSQTVSCSWICWLDINLLSLYAAWSRVSLETAYEECRISLRREWKFLFGEKFTDFHCQNVLILHSFPELLFNPKSSNGTKFKPI